jgi:hypothetical protein
MDYFVKHISVGVMQSFPRHPGHGWGYFLGSDKLPASTKIMFFGCR